MARNIKLSNGKIVRYPDESDLKSILKEISSDAVESSYVLPKNAPPADVVKYKLCTKIVDYKISHKISQKELAQKLKLDEPETSRILNYKIERYSIERLLAYANLLFPKLTLEVLAA